MCIRQKYSKSDFSSKALFYVIYFEEIYTWQIRKNTTVCQTNTPKIINSQL